MQKNKKKLKIAFFTDTYLPNIDGVVSSILTLKKQMEKLGHTVYIFSPKLKGIKKRKNVFYYESIPFPPYPAYRGAIDLINPVLKINEIKPDIIHSHALATMGMASILASKFNKIPSIETFHTMVPLGAQHICKDKNGKEIVKKILWSYIQLYLRPFKIITVPSEFTKKQLKKRKINSIVISNGIDYSYLKKSKIDLKIIKKYNLMDKKIILHVGRVVTEKNLDILINSAKHIIKKEKNAKFVIVGHGPAKKYYEDKVKKMNLQDYFVFTGFLKKKELVSFYKFSYVLAFPSTFETQGLVALEAMACKTPVVGLYNTALEEIIKHKKNGMLSTKNAFDFYKNIIYAMNNENLGKQAQIDAKKYDVVKKTKEMIDLYYKIIK